MASSEALIKYYDCLKDSFNKIQDKDNKTALINAALRPKIREEFTKSQEVLVSYLNYIQVFSLIYSDKFVNICNNIIIPLFKENEIKTLNSTNELTEDTNGIAEKVHETIETIIKSRYELTDDIVHSVVKIFPSISGIELDKNKAFITYLKNCLKICTYLTGEPLIILATKVLDKLNPPLIESLEEIELEQIRHTVDKSFEIIYDCLKELDDTQLEKITTALITAFTREFLSSTNQARMNYLLFYVCSLNVNFADFLINSLWSTFTNSSRPLEERRASVNFASSFMSRANYIDLNKVFIFLETANNWCDDFLDEYIANKIHKEERINENVEAFYALTQSMFYLITQRYREMYEDETIARFAKLNLNKIIQCQLKPLEACDLEIGRRFHEVATLYHITSFASIRSMPISKRRKSDRDSRHPSHWKAPFKETCMSMDLPEQIQPLYRNYYDHRNFTIYRE